MIFGEKDKFKITQAVFELAKDKILHDSLTTIDDLVSEWWVTKRTGNGLALSKDGYMAFMAAGISRYHVPIFEPDEQITGFINSTRLKIDKYMQCPYYLHFGKWRPKLNKQLHVVNPKENEQPQAIVFDDDFATMLLLYGSISKYLEVKSK